LKLFLNKIPHFNLIVSKNDGIYRFCLRPALLQDDDSQFSDKIFCPSSNATFLIWRNMTIRLEKWPKSLFLTYEETFLEKGSVNLLSRRTGTKQKFFLKLLETIVEDSAFPKEWQFPTSLVFQLDLSTFLQKLSGNAVIFLRANPE